MCLEPRAYFFWHSKLPFLLPSSLLKPATYIWYWTPSDTGPLGTWSLKWRRSCEHEPIANIELDIKGICHTEYFNFSFFSLPSLFFIHNLGPRFGTVPIVCKYTLDILLYNIMHSSVNKKHTYNIYIYMWYISLCTYIYISVCVFL